MTDQQRRHAFDAAIQAHSRSHPQAPLHHQTARLLAVMFEHGDECARSLASLVDEGFTRQALAPMLHALTGAGLLHRHPGRGRTPDTYTLRLLVGADR